MAEDKPVNEQKRRVKNPETFRERAIKAAEQDGQPGRRARLGSRAAGTVRPVTGPLGRFFRKLFSLKPIRIIGRILLPRYFRNSWRELRLVQWPNRRESRQLTFAVLVFAITFGILVAGVDFGLDRLFRAILIK